jgi:hypothetical protein
MVCFCEVHGESSILVLYAGILFGASVNNVLSILQGSEEEVSKSIDAGKWPFLFVRFLFFSGLHISCFFVN